MAIDRRPRSANGDDFPLSRRRGAASILLNGEDDTLLLSNPLPLFMRVVHVHFFEVFREENSCTHRTKIGAPWSLRNHCSAVQQAERL